MVMATYRNGDNTLFAYFLHGPGEQITNFPVPIGRYCSYLIQEVGKIST